MIRPLTCVCMLLAGASGLYLYQTKHRTGMLDRQIQQTLREAEADRARIGILQAEWALLNDPERLAELADRFLALKPVTPSQFVTLSDLDRRLPMPVPQAPAAASPEVASNGTGEPAAAAPAPAADVVPVAMAEPPAPPPEPRKTPPISATPKPPLQLASNRYAATRRETDLAEHRAASARREPRPAKERDVPAAHESSVVAAARRAAPVTASARIASPRPTVAPVIATASARPPATRAVVYAPAGPSAAFAPMVRPVALAPAMATGSMLGATHVSLPPPVPVSNATTGWAGAR